MQIIQDIATMRDFSASCRHQQQTLAFVPTMGNLHQGHLSLVKQAQQLADKVIVSLFVNQRQFAPHEDFDSYPRTLSEDCQQLESLGVDVVFAPAAQTLYPNGAAQHCSLSLAHLNKLHCGQSRPHFFDGVITIVNKLFNIVQADYAIFGEKDYQQLLCIRQMVQDLCLPIKIIAAPTQRNSHGLALSSRNQYLTQSQLELAPFLQQTLQDVKTAIMQQANEHQLLQQQASDRLNQAGFKTDYFHICDSRTLQIAEPSSQNFVILAAAFLGKARLIDNVIFSRPQESSCS